jgi:ATP-dependent DNA ligase
MLTLINAIPRPEPFDHADWLFELKFDGFRAAATRSTPAGTRSSTGATRSGRGRAEWFRERRWR